jgi:hypothetical protein
MDSKPVVVTITVVNGKCQPDPEPFPADNGRTVTFRFDEYPNADIIFTNESPFAEAHLTPGPQYTVTADEPKGTRFPYTVQWSDRAGGGISGNGTGEVTAGG